MKPVTSHIKFLVYWTINEINVKLRRKKYVNNTTSKKVHCKNSKNKQKKDSDVFTQISKHKYLHEKFCTTEVMCKTQLLIKGCIK